MDIKFIAESYSVHQIILQMHVYETGCHRTISVATDPFQWKHERVTGTNLNSLHAKAFLCWKHSRAKPMFRGSSCFGKSELVSSQPGLERDRLPEERLWVSQFHSVVESGVHWKLGV